LHHGLNEAALRKDREMTNPLTQFRSGLFGSRGVDVAASLEYVDQLASASSDPVAVQTAARVLLNTVIGAVDQILTSRSPERLALIELIDERIAASAINIDQQISDWMDSNVDHDHLISEWLSDNFDVTDYNINDAIHEWSSDNLADEVEKVIKNSLTFSVIVN
jgi:hypothetical protein